MSVTRKRCLRGHREGTTSHSHLSLHRWDVTLLMEGSGASITAEECSYIPAHLTLIWVLHLERRTSVSLGDETHRATTVAILNVGPLYVSARTWMHLPGTIRNIMECKTHNKTFCSSVKFERRGPWTIFLVNQRSRHRKAAKKTLFTQSGYFSYDVDKNISEVNIKSICLHSNEDIDSSRDDTTGNLIWWDKLREYHIL